MLFLSLTSEVLSCECVGAVAPALGPCDWSVSLSAFIGHSKFSAVTGRRAIVGPLKVLETACVAPRLRPGRCEKHFGEFRWLNIKESRVGQMDSMGRLLDPFFLEPVLQDSFYGIAIPGLREGCGRTPLFPQIDSYIMQGSKRNCSEVMGKRCRPSAAVLRIPESTRQAHLTSEPSLKYLFVRRGS